MKLILTATLAATLATSAVAGQSDRYHDLRLDTAKGHATSFDAESGTTSVAPRQPAVALSSRSGSDSSGDAPDYAYANPYGVGPDNDSR